MEICTCVGLPHFPSFTKYRIISMCFYSLGHANHFWSPSRKGMLISKKTTTHPTCKLATWPAREFEESDNRKGLDPNDEGRILQAAGVLVFFVFKTTASFHCGRKARTKASFSINPTNRPLKPPFTTLTRAEMVGLMVTLLPVK